MAAGHTSDNVIVWIAEQKILFGGCFVKPEGLGNLGDAVIKDEPASAEKLISCYSTAKIVVPGHGKIGDASLLEKTKAQESINAKNDSHLPHIKIKSSGRRRYAIRPEKTRREKSESQSLGITESGIAYTARAG